MIRLRMAHRVGGKVAERFIVRAAGPVVAAAAVPWSPLIAIAIQTWDVTSFTIAAFLRVRVIEAADVTSNLVTAVDIGALSPGNAIGAAMAATVLTMPFALRTETA